jgi:superfamily II DNA or RNA helicase
MSFEEYERLFAEHRSTAVPSLWEWQREVLRAYSELDGDAAVELPTGTGKTLIGLLIGEHFRATPGRRIAYVAGNKQLAQQGRASGTGARLSGGPLRGTEGGLG